MTSDKAIKTIAITGATGFVGRHLVPHLLAQDYRVRALVRSPMKLPEAWRQNPLFEVIQGDLTRDLAPFANGADLVIHMAGLIKARTRAEFMAINADGCEAIGEAAKQAGVSKLILLSSMAAREPQLSDYAASKRAGEEAARSAFGRDISIIRAPAVFGPGDEATKPIFDLIKKGWLPVTGGDWKNVNIAMVYIKDLVRFIEGCIEAGAPSSMPIEPATIGSMSWHQFAALCTEATGKRVRVLPIPPPVILSVAAVTSVTSRLLGAGHLTLQKLREFRHPDWTSADEVDNPTPMITALRETAQSYES